MADITPLGQTGGQSGTGGAVVIDLTGFSLAEGDVIVAVGGFGNQSAGTPGPTTEDYETLLAPFSGGTNLPIAGAWAKRMGVVPDDEIEFVGSGSGIFEAVYNVYALRDVDPGAILDVIAVTTAGGADPPSITTVTNKSLVIPVVFSAAGTYSAAPSGYGNLSTRSQGGTWTMSIASATKAVDPAGTENPGTFSASGVLSARSFTLAIRAAGNSLAPLAPTLGLLGGSGFVQFSSGPFRPHPDDPTDTHQSTKYQLSTSPTFGTLVIDEELGDPNKLTYQEEGIAPGTYYGRIAHVGDDFDGDWSATLTVEVTDEDAGDTPSLSLVQKGDDFIEDQVSAYNHPEGEVEPTAFDPANPKPYLAKTEFQIRLAADPDWSTPLLTVEVAYDGTAETRKVRWNGLTPGESYKRRARQFDGHLAAYTDFSGDLTTTTDALPADAPDKPTTVATCGRDVVVNAGEPYSHSTSGAGTAHAATEFGIGYGGVFRYVIVNSPVTTYTWLDVRPGSATFVHRYKDEAGRWGERSDGDTCDVADFPPPVRFTGPSASVLGTNQTLSWVFQNPGATAWRSNIRRSVNGGAWETVATDQVAQNTPFNAGSLLEGDYVYQVQSVHPDTGEAGEWGTKHLVVQRTQTAVRVFHRNKTQLGAGAGVRGWDGAEHVAQTGRAGEGLFFSRVHSGTTIRHSVRLFPEAGEMDQGIVTVTYQHHPRNASWYPYLFAEAWITQAGPLISGVDGSVGVRSGRAAFLDIGIRPWYLDGNMLGVSTSFQNQARAVSAQWAALNPGLSIRFGRSFGQGKIRTVTARNGSGSFAHSTTALPSSTEDEGKAGGPYINHALSGLDPVVHPIVMQMQAIRSGSSRTFRVRVLAAGVGVEDGAWHTSAVVADSSSGDTLPCGAIGFAFTDMDEAGVGRSEGILFTEITARITSFGTCIASEEPCQSGKTLNRILSIKRYPDHAEVEYMTIGSVPCPPEA